MAGHELFYVYFLSRERDSATRGPPRKVRRLMSSVQAIRLGVCNVFQGEVLCLAISESKLN